MLTVMMPNSMDGAMPAHRERKQVSACVCARMAPRAEMCICARARAGVPLRASPLSPFGETLRSQFRGWDPSERRAGLHTRECTPSRATQRLEHDVDGNRIACARTLASEPPNACANQSLYHEDHEDMGSCWAVHKSKRSTLGSAGSNPAQHLRHCKHRLRQKRTLPAYHER